MPPRSPARFSMMPKKNMPMAKDTDEPTVTPRYLRSTRWKMSAPSAATVHSYTRQHSSRYRPSHGIFLTFDMVRKSVAGMVT